MNRRTFLATAGVVGVAGCLESSTTPEDTETSTPTDDESPFPAGARDTATCPPFGDSVDSVVCYDDIEPAAVPLVLEPSTTEAALPEATISFTLTNDTGYDFAYNPYKWKLWKYVGGDWYHIAPYRWKEPLSYLEPGDKKTWTLGIDTTDSNSLTYFDGVRASDSKSSLAGLGGGTYAYATDGWFKNEIYGRIGLGATFDLDGEPVEITPTDDVTETARDGDTVTVHTDREHSENHRMAAVTLTRVDDPDQTPQSYIPEQVIWDRRLRNTLPFFDDETNTVRLEEPNGITPAFSVRDPKTVEYNGETYRMSAEELEQ